MLFKLRQCYPFIGLTNTSGMHTYGDNVLRI